MISWVFFDLGGTLLDDSELFQRITETYLDLLNARGRTVSLREFVSVRDLLLARQEHPLFRAVLLDFLRSPAVADEIRREAVPRLAGWEVSAQRAFPEAAEVLEAVSRHANLGVIANQYRTVHEVLRRDGLNRFFRVVAISEEVGASKPEPVLFERALREAGCKASEAVMVGDRIDNDIGPAKALGFHTVLVRWGAFKVQIPTHPSQRADVEVASLRDVPRAIERLARGP